MQYKDFLVLQGRVIDVLKNYAIFLKRGAQLNYRYTKEYKDEILKDFIIRNENTMLVTALSLLNDNKSLEEVDKYIQDYNKSIHFRNQESKMIHYNQIQISLIQKILK